MYLVKPVQFEQVALAIGAVQRRVVRPSSADSLWKFDAAAGEQVRLMASASSSVMPTNC